MQPETSAQLRALEERVAHLERLAGVTRAPGEAPASPVAAHAGEPPPRTTAQIAAALSAQRVAPVAQPTPATPPSPRTTGSIAAADVGGDRADERAPAATKDTLEQYLGATVLARLGAAALFLAAVYFAQLGWRYLGPTSKVLGIYALGGVLLALGAWLRPRVAPRYVAILWGAAVADAYLAGVVAKLVYDLVSAPVALGLLVGACALGQSLAQRLRVQAIATVALAGAVAAPLLTGGDAPTPTLLLVYLLVVHAWAAWLEHRWQWDWARGVAFVGAGTVAWLWYAAHWRGLDTALVLQAQLFHLGLVAPEFLAAARRREIRRERSLVVSGSAAALTLGFALYAAFQRALPAHPLASGLAWLAVAAALAPRAAALARDLGRLGGVLVPIGLAIAWPRLWDAGADTNDLWRALALLAATVGLLALRRRIGVGELGATVAVAFAAGSAFATQRPAFGVPPALLAAALLLLASQPALARVAGLLLGLAVAGFAVVAHASTELGASIPHLATAAAFGWLAAAGLAAAWRTDRAVAAAVAIATTVVSCQSSLRVLAALAAGEHALAWPLWNTPALAFAAGLGATVVAARATADTRHRVALAAATLLATYAFGLGEVLDALHAAERNWRAVGMSLYTALFAAGLLVLGFRRKAAALRLAALGVFLGVTVKVGLHDLAHLPTPLRVLVTGVLGAVLLVAAWSYARRRAST